MRVAASDSEVVDNYCIENESATTRLEHNRSVTGATHSLRGSDSEGEITAMEPVFNRYARPPAVATPAVHTGLVSDVFVALATVPEEDVVLDVMVFPLMCVLWAGGLVTFDGGMWAVFARKPQREVEHV